MAIVQDTYDIPMDINTKILNGEFRRIGSVVRYAIGPNKGQIVKLLKPKNLEATKEEKGLGAKVFQLAKNNKKALVVVGISVGIGAAGVTLYKKIRNSEPKVVKELRAALKTYIEAIRKGNMSIETINRLMTSLDELKKYKDYEKVSIQLTTEELGILVGRIYKYTIKLAKDNSVKLTEEELSISDKENDGIIINLQTYLKAQKRIFEEVV